MLTRSELEEILDKILNKSDFNDLQVIQAAMERRGQDLNRVGGAGIDPGSMAQNMASAIQGQIAGTQEGLENMVRGFVEQMILEKAPEIPKEHLDALLAEWVPNKEQKKIRAENPAQNQALPMDVLMSMAKDFIAYSSGTMATARLEALNEAIPDWPKAYWKRFPDKAQRLIKAFLEGKIPIEVFWEELQRV